MNKLEITELPDNKYVIWYNGKNVLLNKDINTSNIIKLLYDVMHFLINKLL